MKLTISGEPASGKGTIGKKLAEHYNLEYLCLGDLKREEAQRRNLTIVEFDEWCNSNPKEGDEVFDELMAKKGKDSDDFIFDGWLSFHFIPQAINILLRCDAKTAGKRVYADVTSGKRSSEHKYDSEKEAMEATANRYKANRDRWNNIYGITIYDDQDFDIIVDTSDATVNEVFAVITAQINAFLEKE